MSEHRISGASGNPRSEVDIRVDTVNPSRIIAAANDIGGTAQVQCFSADAGRTWGQSTLPLQPGDGFHSDPAVDWTSDGTAWAITIGVGAGTNLALRCYRSTDGGKTWSFHSSPVTQNGVDRETMWVDRSPTSPWRDQIYVTYHVGTPAFVVRRTTGPGAAWQPAGTTGQVSDAQTTGLAIGGDIKTNSQGDVFVFWPDTGGSGLVQVARSTDGGATFGAPVTIGTLFASSRVLSIPADPRPPRGARVYVSGGAFFRSASQNMVYAVWPDLSGASGCTSGNGPGTSTSSKCKTRIWFSRSTDGGATWATPKMVNDQASLNDQFHSRLHVDETNGDLVLVYYDTVGDSNRVKTDVWLQYSTDDGLNWSTASKLTTAQTDETAAGADNGAGGNQYGDYAGLTGHAGNFFSAWTDRRSGGREEIWSTGMARTGVPLAAPDTGLTSWTDGAYQHVAYLDQDGMVQELYYEIGTGPWRLAHLTTLAAAPTAVSASSLTSWEDTNGAYQHVAYLDVDNSDVHELYFEIGVGPWKHTDLTKAASLPPAPPAPPAVKGTVLTSWTEGPYQHVAYLDVNGHVHELYYEIGAGPWQHADLMDVTGAVRAQPRALTSWVDSGRQHVAYVSAQGHVCELYYEFGVGPWKPNDLTAAATSPTPAPLAADLSMLTSWTDDKYQHVVYASPDRHLHELYYEIGVGPWQHADLTTKAPTAPLIGIVGGALTSWQDGPYQHVAYVGDDARIHELYFEIGIGPWKHNDLTTAAATPTQAPPAPVDSLLTSWDGGGYQHVVYVTPDGHVHELYYEIGVGPWKHSDLMTAATA